MRPPAVIPDMPVAAAQHRDELAAEAGEVGVGQGQAVRPATCKLERLEPAGTRRIDAAEGRDDEHIAIASPVPSAPWMLAEPSVAALWLTVLPSPLPTKIRLLPSPVVTWLMPFPMKMVAAPSPVVMTLRLSLAPRRLPKIGAVVSPFRWTDLRHRQPRQPARNPACRPARGATGCRVSSSGRGRR